MNNEISGIVFIFLLAVALAIPLGKYIAKIFGEGKPFADGFFSAIEKFIFRLSGINPTKQMTWVAHLKALLTINLIWFFWAMLLLMTQSYHFWNPDHNPSMSPDLAFNTAISFLVNANLQHYSGETGLSYLSQLACITFLQFVTAATGIAACVVVFKAFKEKQGTFLGNFYDYFVKTVLRILLPISIISSIILVFSGVPMTFLGKDNVQTVEGVAQQVSRGPAAAMIAIKQAGTNGGGFFGVNSAHPLENPTYLTNIVENLLIILIPIALVFALGYYVKNKKLSRMIFGVMTIGFLMLLIPSVLQEMQGNKKITTMGISQIHGSMEGKETRFGAAASAFWGVTTTVTSNGSVNAMHDSMTPLSGLSQLMGMMVNAFYGGVGVGFLNFYVFLILAVFISGLMVGRTPEFLGKKIEAREMKIAMMIALLHPLLILGGTALSSFLIVLHQYGWLNNPGYHGFSEMMYEYTSAAANNGSGFEGLADNTPFWNISTGVVLILSRFLPIIGPVAIAGLLAAKKQVPESAGTLKTDTGTFGVMIMAVILIIAALSFFPALTLGPLAEYFSL
ncbi:MAG: potassium-transporting ATPase subunit KdpA [Pelobium sp.]